MLTRTFYDHLEYRISAALRTSSDKSLRRYWCDGILEPEWAEDYRPGYVRRSGQVVLRAWIDEGPSKGGSSVQCVYRLVLKLGSEALAAYVQGQSPKHHLPGPESDDWVWLNPQKQVIEVKLA